MLSGGDIHLDSSRVGLDQARNIQFVKGNRRGLFSAWFQTVLSIHPEK